MPQAHTSPTPGWTRDGPTARQTRRAVWAGLEFICCSSLELVYKAKTNKNSWNNNIFKKPCQQLSIISLYFDKSFF